MSKEFVRGNFEGRELHDVVVVSANPWYQRIKQQDGFEVFKLIQTGINTESVVEASLDALSNYPNKRHIIHFMQPHRPFHGPTGLSLEENSGENIDLQTLVYQSNASESELIEAYIENLQVGFEAVSDIVAVADGKIAVSSDHGELLNDREWPVPVKRYGHPPGVYTEKLVTVPWQEVQQGPRIRITSDIPEETDTGSDVESRLEALGYK